MDYGSVTGLWSVIAVLLFGMAAGCLALLALGLLMRGK